MKRAIVTSLAGMVFLVWGCGTVPRDAPAGPRSPFAFRPDGRGGDDALVRTLEGAGASGRRWYQHVQTLSNPYFEGRAPGTEGAARAREYVQDHFQRVGLRPAFGRSYEQPFAFRPSDGAARIGGVNLGGIIEGDGEDRRRWIILGAHLDHLGGAHPGADDNASGVAALLVLADLIAEHRRNSPDLSGASILFIVFDAEEPGLFGSRWFVEHPPIELAAVECMINLDMVGRLRGDEIMVLGTGSRTDLPEVLTWAAQGVGLRVHMLDATSGRADDTSFAHTGVPAIHVFTGLHDDYHTPRDEAWRTHPIGAARVLTFVERLIDALEVAGGSGSVVSLPRRRS